MESLVLDKIKISNNDWNNPQNQSRIIVTIMEDGNIVAVTPHNGQAYTGMVILGKNNLRNSCCSTSTTCPEW